MNRVLETKIKPSKVLSSFGDLLKASVDPSIQRVVNLIAEAFEDQPIDLTSKIDSFIRSFGLMEFIGLSKLIISSKKLLMRVEFFYQIKKMLIDWREEQAQELDASVGDLDRTVYSFEKTNAMLSAPYNKEAVSEQDMTGYKPVDDRRNEILADNSAMNLNAMSDYDLSQILNPNVDIILDDSHFETKHYNTSQASHFLWRVFFYIEKKITKNAHNNLAIGFSSLKNCEANCTQDVLRMVGTRRATKAKTESLKRVLLILSGCIRERESRAIAVWHEALLNHRYQEISYQKIIYQMHALAENKTRENKKSTFVEIKRYARWVLKEQERLAAEQGRVDKEHAGDLNLVITEFLKRCVLKRLMAGFSGIKRIWTGEQDAKARLENLEKKASIMILENCLSRFLSDRKTEALMEMIDYNEQALLRNPKKVAWCDFAKQLRIKFNGVDARVQKYKFFRYLRFLYSDRYRKGLLTLLDSLHRFEVTRKNFSLRMMFNKNIDVLKREKILSFFSGFLNKLLKNQERKNKRIGLTHMNRIVTNQKRVLSESLILEQLLSRLIKKRVHTIFVSLYKATKLNFLMSKEREKYIRSLRLQGAVIFCSVLKNVMSRYWAHRSRHTLTYLRKWNNTFKKPLVQKRFLILLYLFRDKQGAMVRDAFDHIKNKGTFLLLQRFFAKNINFSNGINHEVLFAIKNSAKTKNAHLNQLVQFWNISYCSEEPEVIY